MSNPTLTRAEFYEFLARGFGLSAEARVVEDAVPVRAAARICRRGTPPALLSALVIDEAQSLPVRAARGSAAPEQHRDADGQAAERRARRPAGAGRPAERDRAAAAEAAHLAALRAEAARPPRRRPPTSPAGCASPAATGADLHARSDSGRSTSRRGGIPRTVNVICDNALIGGFAAQIKPVDARDRRGGLPRLRLSTARAESSAAEARVIESERRGRATAADGRSRWLLSTQPTSA